MLSTFFVLSSLIVAGLSNPTFIPQTLPISRKLNFNGTSTIVDRDRARVAAFRSRNTTRRAIVDEPVDNAAVLYTASIGVGSPATTCTLHPLTCMINLTGHIPDELIIDTGSSNTWVGAGIKYVQTSTSVQTPNLVSVTYGSGSFSGREFTDQVTLAPGLIIKSQSIGVATVADCFSGLDGILGIGPIDLTEGTLSPATSTLIPTVTDNLFSQGSITNHAVGVYFAPTTQEEVVNGEISWGGPDNSKIVGSISYAPITTTFPASEFWGIDESITYGTSTTILSSTAGIVDTGTTLTLIASDAFHKYQTVTGATLDSTTGLLRITPAQFSNLQSLFFKINGVSYELTPNAQIWPRSLNADIGGSSSAVYLIVNDIGTNSGEGLDFINGYTFLERFYTVFDTANERVGFGVTAQTRATTN